MEVANGAGVEDGMLVCSGETDVGVCCSGLCPWAEPGIWLLPGSFNWLQGYKVGKLGVGADGVGGVVGLFG